MFHAVIGKPQRLVNVPGKEDEKQDREIQEIPMNVLQDQRKSSLAPIVAARLADRASRRIGPEGFVISSAIVIAGKTKSARRPKDQKRGSEWYPRRYPCRLWSKPGSCRTEQLRRIQRR